jgi:hypothetical protein
MYVCYEFLGVIAPHINTSRPTAPKCYCDDCVTYQNEAADFSSNSALGSGCGKFRKYHRFERIFVHKIGYQ